MGDGSGNAIKKVRETGEKVGRKAQDKLGGPARFQIILMLAAILGLDGADKAAVSAVADSLQKVFAIGNTQIGILIAVVSFTGAIATLPIGILVDRINRRRVLIAAIALWSAAMVVSGISQSFMFLLVTRIALGAVTATATPAVASLLGDFFKASERARIYGLVLTGELVGTGIGFFVAGEVSAWLNWRWAFFSLSIPSALLAAAVWKYLPEPARGGQSWLRPGQEEIVTGKDAAEGRAPDKADQDGIG